jgi:hypothetical protein
MEILILFLAIFFVYKCFDLNLNNEESSVGNIPWESMLVMVTALAWYSQNQLNKKHLENDAIVKQRELLRIFKEDLGQIRQQFDSSMMYWFLYKYEEYEYKMKNLKFNSSCHFNPLSQISRCSLVSNNYKYDEENKVSRLIPEFKSEIDKPLTKKTLGIITKTLKTKQSVVVAKGNRNTQFFDKKGYLFSANQSFPVRELKEEEKLSHLILKNCHGGNMCLLHLIGVLKRIESEFKDRRIRNEALRILFETDFYKENLEIIKRAFWFKIDSGYNRNLRMEKIIKLTFKKYKFLHLVNKNLEEINDLWRRLFGLSPFFNTHPGGF